MNNIRELLRAADPLRHEPPYSSRQRDVRRQAILAAASGAGGPAEPRSRSRIVLFATITLMVIAALFLGSRKLPFFVADLQAAVRFEVRLAEEKPAPGLVEAKVSGSDRAVYLHKEIVVTNSDIARARIAEGGGPSRYSVDLEFNASGAEKMRAATMNHIGKPVAILLDGQVVLAPTLRAVIGASAMITGNYTREQAERIVNGIVIQ